MQAILTVRRLLLSGAQYSSIRDRAEESKEGVKAKSPACRHATGKLAGQSLGKSARQPGRFSSPVKWESVFLRGIIQCLL